MSALDMHSAGLYDILEMGMRITYGMWKKAQNFTLALLATRMLAERGLLFNMVYKLFKTTDFSVEP